MTESNETIETTEQPSDLDRAIAIVNPMIESGASDEDMVIALIGSGFKFQKAGRLLTKAQEAAGVRMSAKDRYASAEELLTGWSFAPESWDDVDQAADALAEEIDATSKAQAISCIKKFVKAAGLEMPSKPKRTGGSREGVFERFIAWALANKDASDEDIANYATSVCESEKQANKYAQRFIQFVSLARAWNV